MLENGDVRIATKVIFQRRSELLDLAVRSIRIARPASDCKRRRSSDQVLAEFNCHLATVFQQRMQLVGHDPNSVAEEFELPPTSFCHALILPCSEQVKGNIALGFGGLLVNDFRECRERLDWLANSYFQKGTGSVAIIGGTQAGATARSANRTTNSCVIGPKNAVLRDSLKS